MAWFRKKIRVEPVASLVGKSLSLSVLFDTVTIQIRCGDSYEAQVIYDDLVERARSGDGFSLAVSCTRVRGSGRG